VLKPNEQRIVNFLRRLDCQVVVRSGGLLAAFQEGERPPLIGDFSLNAANVLSAASYFRLGIERLAPTHDLNAAQVADLAREFGPQKIEVIAYQHLPVFHTEHCVFCRFLSSGTSYKDCGHPCESHRVALRDDHGRVHPVMADVGCRNTVFGAEAQEASRHLDLWRQVGIQHYRLEFVHETADEVRDVVVAFSQALGGHLSAAELARRLQRIAPQGTTEGSLFIAPDYLELPLLQ
jgi:U32 family peptidase